MNTLESPRNYLVTYAQNREDVYIRAIFGEGYEGFYIDVGSNHPIHHSVTKLLYRAGWHGINVDPNKTLIELTKYDRPRDVQLQCGVGDKPGKLTFRQYHNHGLSTFSEDMKQAYGEQSSEFTDEYTDIEVEVRTLKDICIEQKVKTIDLLKVDVEGYEQQLLDGNDWNQFRPKVICIEANHKKVDWHDFLISRGYKVKTTDGLNDYYVDTSCELADTPVRMAETALIYPHIVDNDVAGLITLQRLRLETNTIIRDALRTPSRKVSVRLLKESIRTSMDELKFLVKEHSKHPRVTYTPTQVVQAPQKLSGLKTYINSVNDVYTQSLGSMQQYEQSQLPKTKAGGFMKRAKLAGYDTPKLLLGEAGKIARRRMK
jgi:FkbM family methyltransferase